MEEEASHVLPCSSSPDIEYLTEKICFYQVKIQILLKKV